MGCVCSWCLPACLLDCLPACLPTEQIVKGGIFAAGESLRSRFSVVLPFRDFYREYKHLSVSTDPKAGKGNQQGPGNWQSLSQQVCVCACVVVRACVLP